MALLKRSPGVYMTQLLACISRRPQLVSPILRWPLSRGFGSGTNVEDVMKQALSSQLSASFVSVADTSGGCGDFYRVTVVSPKFIGLPLVQQHRLVNAVLKKEISGAHGITVSTMTPEQFERLQQKQAS